MSSVNKAIIVGRLGQEPETRRAPSGDAICNLSVATSESWKSKDGERREKTEWHRVVLFGRTAEVAAQYLRKGSQIYIEGRIQTRKWTDKDGNERYTTEIRGDVMRMLGGKSGVEQDAQRAQPAQQARPQAPVDDQFDLGPDDIPF